MLCVYEPIADTTVDGLPGEESCIQEYLHVVHSVADVDEANINAPVAVDQRVAWRKLYGHSLPCGPSVYHHASQFIELLGARSTAFKLALLWNRSAALELLLCDRKILLHEG
ncbi:hypothetical protein TNCV_4538241 [Trichonephila clavipes]|uniref:Uncharacterized protein n=1 Tax=Trichonephila clavipes TaxID=2585209 RepID=A0A8X7BIY3_TRICX|nr:hypothetical protein TNCV_4538241 [Trichonephila clavipes]